MRPSGGGQDAYRKGHRAWSSFLSGFPAVLDIAGSEW